MSLKRASKELHINYSSAKTIMQTLKYKGRIHKKLTRDRRPKLYPRPPVLGVLYPSLSSTGQGTLPPLSSLLVPREPQAACQVRPQSRSNSSWDSDVTTHEECWKVEFRFFPYSHDIAATSEAHFQDKSNRLLALMGAKILPVPHNNKSSILHSSNHKQGSNNPLLSDPQERPQLYP